jgi:hypothetical protein
MPDIQALPEAKSKLLEEAFRDAEASLLLEGLDPTTDPGYRVLKARFIAGTITFEEAKAAIAAQYREAPVVQDAFVVSA